MTVLLEELAASIISKKKKEIYVIKSFLRHHKRNVFLRLRKRNVFLRRRKGDNFIRRRNGLPRRCTGFYDVVK